MVLVHDHADRYRLPKGMPLSVGFVACADAGSSRLGLPHLIREAASSPLGCNSGNATAGSMELCNLLPRDLIPRAQPKPTRPDFILVNLTPSFCCDGGAGAAGSRPATRSPYEPTSGPPRSAPTRGAAPFISRKPLLGSEFTTRPATMPQSSRFPAARRVICPHLSSSPTRCSAV